MIESLVSQDEINIIKNNFSTLLNKEFRKKFLVDKLNCIKTPEQLVAFFSRYITFNSVVGGSIARLAGAAHVLQKSFLGDQINRSASIYSTSSKIASYILAAAEDEFNSKTNGIRVTHCEMAAFFFDSVNEYFSLISPFEENLSPLTNEVMNSYCFFDMPEDAAFFNGLGFHVASEELADLEFNCIRNFLKSNFIDLIYFLQNKENAFGLPSSFWIDIHCVVEKEHTCYGLKAIEIAMESYSGTLSDFEVKCNIESGYNGFCKLQYQMLEYCCSF